MAEKRHHEHKRPKVTTTQHDSMPSCICPNRIPGAKMSSCRCEPEGGCVKETVRREGHRGAGRVPSGTVGAYVVRQQPHDPHRMGDEHLQRLNDIPSHFNTSASPAFIPGNFTEGRASSHSNNNPTIGDALLPYIARHTLLAKLAPFFTGTVNNTEKMEVAVVGKKHRTVTKSKHSSEESSRRHRHHNHHGHQSDGELEIERVKAKVRGDDRLKEREVNSSSDRGKAERKHRRRERSSLSPGDKPKREESDLEREERRRRRRARKLEEELRKEGIDTEKRRESKSRKERKERGNESDRPSSKSDRDKQVVLHTEGKRSSSKTPEVIASGSSSPRRKHTREHSYSDKDKDKDKDKGKEVVDETKGAVLGFVLEKKERVVKCVTCLSDDIPRHQAAKLQCGHYFCNDCLKRLFDLSLTDPAHMPPRCCTRDHIPLKHVDRLLTYQTKKLWNKKYAEYTTANRIYCPTRDCGEWIQPRDIMGKIGRCSRCKGKVCTMCNGKAHGLKDCPKDEDLKVFVETAKANGYQRCFSCRSVVELERGCNHITCRCTAEFCYLCGDKWKTCDCPWFAYPDSDDEEEDSDNEPPARVEEPVVQQEQPVPVVSDPVPVLVPAQVEATHPDKDAQIAEDEALARRMAQTAYFLEDDAVDELNVEFEARATRAADAGSLRSGLRKDYKKLADEYAEASRRDEQAREERVRERLQKLRDRDEAVKAARRDAASGHRDASGRRHSEPRVVTRPSSSSNRPSTSSNRPSTSSNRPSTSSNRPSTASGQPTTRARVTLGSPPAAQQDEEAVRRQLFDDERAARIAKYIRGEVDDLGDEEYTPSPVRTAPVPAVAESSTGVRRSHTERVRRATTSEVSPRTARPTRTSRKVPEALDLASGRSHSHSKVPSSHSRSKTDPNTSAYYSTAPGTYPSAPVYERNPTHKSRLADTSFTLVQQPTTHHKRQLSNLYIPTTIAGPPYSAYPYAQYPGYSPVVAHGGRAVPFTPVWSGMEPLATSQWR